MTSSLGPIVCPRSRTFSGGRPCAHRAVNSLSEVTPEDESLQGVPVAPASWSKALQPFGNCLKGLWGLCTVQGKEFGKRSCPPSCNPLPHQYIWSQ